MCIRQHTSAYVSIRIRKLMSDPAILSMMPDPNQVKIGVVKTHKY